MMNKYNDYRQIDLPWLKDIPSHWGIRRNKNIFTEMKNEVGEDSDKYTLLLIYKCRVSVPNSQLGLNPLIV